MLLWGCRRALQLSAGPLGDFLALALASTKEQNNLLLSGLCLYKTLSLPPLVPQHTLACSHTLTPKTTHRIICTLIHKPIGLCSHSHPSLITHTQALSLMLSHTKYIHNSYIYSPLHTQTHSPHLPPVAVRPLLWKSLYRHAVLSIFPAGNRLLRRPDRQKNYREL